ncbi:MAG: hypothetical protein EP332_04565 [Bacteroidetes bacterium]|nr:MAG: hypothetical protein EP332_04565 [Bacteroidota bacterium]
MRTTLNFEHDDTKKLLAKLDFEFFLKQNIEKEKYPQKDIDKIYSSYQRTLKQIEDKTKTDKKQFDYYTEGQVRKMFIGGLLPALFELDESRGHTMFDFHTLGENWAYFKHWQTYYKRKITKEKIWDITVKVGSVLAIILSVLKLLENINIL